MAKLALSSLFAAFVLMFTTLHSFANDGFYREELRIPVIGAGPRGLEALLIRPSGPQRYPLALISHGTPRDASTRLGMTPNWFYAQAIEFARRGFAALVVMRRGYGTSDGGYAEERGCCDLANYLYSANASADDLRAAIVGVKSRTDITTDGMIAVGFSTGGLASIALTAKPPQGLAAVISFAGGRRRALGANNGASDEAALIDAFKTLGKTSRTPMLWVYSENDKYFGPDWAHQLHQAFVGAGGQAQFIDAPTFGNDGHFLFSGEGTSIWTPIVDRFLRDQNLGKQNILAAPALPAIPPPPQLGAEGRTGFAIYLAAGPHKAFAVSPNGAFGYRTGLRSAFEARDAALAGCATRAPDCAVYALDDRRAEENKASRR